MDQCKVTLMKVLPEPGENARIIVPFWVTYPESVRLRKEMEENNIRIKGGS